MAPWTPAEIESLHNFADEKTELLEEPPLAGPKAEPKGKKGASLGSNVKKLNKVKELKLDNRGWFSKMVWSNRKAPKHAKRAIFEIVAFHMDPQTQRDYLSDYLAKEEGSERAYESVRRAFEKSKDEWGAIVLRAVVMSDPSSAYDYRHTMTIDILLPMTREEFDEYGDRLTKKLTIYRPAQEFAYNIAKEIFPELFDGKMINPSLSQIEGTSLNIQPDWVFLAELKFHDDPVKLDSEPMYMTKDSIEAYFKWKTNQLRLLERVAYKKDEERASFGAIPSNNSSAIVVATQQEVEQFMESIDPDNFNDLKYGANRTLPIQNRKR